MNIIKRIFLIIFLLAAISCVGFYYWLERQSISVNDAGIESVLKNDEKEIVNFNKIELELNLKFHPAVIERIKSAPQSHLVIAAKILNDDWRTNFAPKSFLLYSQVVGQNGLSGVKVTFPGYVNIEIGPKQALSIYAMVCPNAKECRFSAEGNIFARGIYSKIRAGRNSFLLYFDTILAAKSNNVQDIYLQANAKIPSLEMAKIAKNWLVVIQPAQTHILFGKKISLRFKREDSFAISQEIIAFAGPLQPTSDLIKLVFPANAVLYPSFMEQVIVKLVPCDRSDGDYYECIFESIRASREKFKKL